MKFYDTSRTGEIISRITNDVTKLQDTVVSGAISIVYQLFTFIGGIGYLFYLNHRLTFFLLIALPLMAYTINHFNQKIRRVSRHVQAKIATISHVLQETISSIRVVKSFGREEYEYSRFRNENEANFRAKLKNIQLSAIQAPSVEFLSATAFTAILWYGGYEVFQGRMRPAELIAYFTLLLTITTPLRSLTKLSSTIQQAFAAAERIFETLDLRDDSIVIHPQARDLERVEGELLFRDISFSYEDGKPVLKDLNLEVEPGQVIALVGASGAGKTTLVDLIPRFYDPTEGEIFLDGVPIKEIALDSLRSFIGIVPQETVLFSGSLRDNIAYGRLEAKREDIIAAARAANAHDFIVELEREYETIIGERGVGLSGGQRQRIAIARAILKDPKILILDEATSALDAESEILVQEALQRLMKDRTTFVIAHRLSTIQNADTIIVLNQGRMVEKGDHRELLLRGGFYYNLYHSSSRASKRDRLSKKVEG